MYDIYRYVYVIGIKFTFIYVIFICAYIFPMVSLHYCY